MITKLLMLLVQSVSKSRLDHNTFKQSPCTSGRHSLAERAEVCNYLPSGQELLLHHIAYHDLGREGGDDVASQVKLLPHELLTQSP